LRRFQQFFQSFPAPRSLPKHKSATVRVFVTPDEANLIMLPIVTRALLGSFRSFGCAHSIGSSFQPLPSGRHKLPASIGCTAHFLHTIVYRLLMLIGQLVACFDGSVHIHSPGKQHLLIKQGTAST
jgi:hypothetical protein